MNVSTATSVNSLIPSTYRTDFGAGPQDFESLANALQSGNLAGAQSAFASLEQDLPGIAKLLQSSSSASSSSTQNSPITKALQSLRSALQSGNLSDAQQAFATLQKGLQDVGHAHRGHHHHHHASGTSATNTTNQATGKDSNHDSDRSTGAPSSLPATSSLLDAQA